MGVRGFLTRLVGAERPRVFHESGVLAEPAVRQDGENGDVAGGVVGHQQELSGLIEGKMARIFAAGGQLI